MSADLRRWHEDGARNGWEMPSAPAWKRLPIIRQLRSIWLEHQVRRWNAFWGSVGMIPSGYDRWVLFGYDRWVLFGIWHGMERPE